MRPHRAIPFILPLVEPPIRAVRFRRLSITSSTKPMLAASRAAWKACAHGTPSHSKGFATMLILSRKEGEGILIGDDIFLIVTELQPGRVRLGLVAPKSVVVLREELVPFDHPGQTVIEAATRAKL